MLSVYRARAFAADAPELQNTQPRWLTLNKATVRECIRLADDPTVNAALEMPIDLVFARPVRVTKEDGKLNEEVEDEVNSWVPEIRMIMNQIDTFGLAIAVIGVDNRPAAVRLETVELQYYYSADQSIHFRIILPQTMEALGSVSSANPLYSNNVFSAQQARLGGGMRKVWSKPDDQESSGSSKKRKKRGEDDDSESGSDDDDDTPYPSENPGRNMTERDRVDRARFHIFVSRKPNPAPESGGVDSRVRRIASSDSFAQKMINAVVVSSVDAARSTAAIESIERKIDSSDPNLDMDFAMFGDHRQAHDEDHRRSNELQHDRVFAQTMIAEGVYSQTTDLMREGEQAGVNQDVDPVSKMRTRPFIQISNAPPIRTLVLAPGTKAVPLPATSVPTESLQESIAKFSTDVANMSGVPASLMAADGSRTNMNVTWAQVTRFTTTCLERETSACVIIKTLFLDVFGSSTLAHSIVSAARRHAARKLSSSKEIMNMPEEDLDPIIDKAVLHIHKLQQFAATVFNSDALDGMRTGSEGGLKTMMRRMKKNTSTERQQPKRRKLKTEFPVHETLRGARTSLGLTLPGEYASRANAPGPGEKKDDQSSGDEQEGEEEPQERLPNIDDFEEFGDDSFHQDVNKLNRITVSFVGMIDYFALIELWREGLVTAAAVRELYMKPVLHIPEEFIPDEPLDPATGIPAAEMYLAEQQTQEQQFKMSVAAKAAQKPKPSGGNRSSSSGGGSGSAPTSRLGLMNSRSVFGQVSGARSSRFDSRVNNS